MKKKNFDDLKVADIGQLRKKVSDLQKAKTNELLELKMGKTKNVHAAKAMKRDIAKIKTIIRMKLTAKTSITKTEKEDKPSGDSVNKTEVKSHAAS